MCALWCVAHCAAADHAPRAPPVAVYSNVYGGVAKAKAGVRAPEDVQNKAATATDRDNLDRALRIVNNDLENVL